MAFVVLRFGTLDDEQTIAIVQLCEKKKNTCVHVYVKQEAKPSRFAKKYASSLFRLQGSETIDKCEGIMMSTHGAL